MCIVAYPPAVNAASVSRRDCQRVTVLIPLWHDIRLVILTDGNSMSPISHTDPVFSPAKHLYCTFTLIGFICYLKTHLFLNKYTT